MSNITDRRTTPNMYHPEVAAEFSSTLTQIERLREVVKDHCDPSEIYTPGGEYNVRTQYGALMAYASQLYSILKAHGY